MTRNDRSAIPMGVRLLGVGLLCLMMAAVPTVLLVIQDWQEWRQLQRQREGVPVTHAIQRLLAALGEHRRSMALLHAGQEQARPEQEEIARRLKQIWREVQEVWVASPGALFRQQALMQEIDAALQRLTSQPKRLSADFNTLLREYRVMAEKIMELQTDGMAEAGLLFERDPGTSLSVTAGLQKAPRVGDALSELAALAASMRIDDIGSVASAFSRYQVQVRELEHLLQVASRTDAQLAERYRAIIERLQRQEQGVAETVRAASMDVNFPLEDMVRVLVQASLTHADVSKEVMQVIDVELDARERRLAARAWWLLLGLSVLWALLVAVLWSTRRAILTPIMSVLETTERIAAGDLSGSVPGGRNDEMGRILKGLGGMQARLHTVVSQIQVSATRVRSTAAEISNANQNLSMRTEHAARQLKGAAAAVEQIAVVVSQTAEGASQAHSLAEGAALQAQGGGEAVSKVVQSMHAIRGTSTRIGEIVAVIDGLAFQTNLLALNAAVEAARAGAQGRGFAVVAGEVRTLAQRSAQAAREIRGLVLASTQQVEQGAVIADHAGAAIRSLVDSVDQVRGTLQSIAQASQQQSLGMAQVNELVSDFDHVTQQNVQLVEESAAAAAAMREQAERMSGLASIFRLRDA